MKNTLLYLCVILSICSCNSITDDNDAFGITPQDLVTGQTVSIEEAENTLLSFLGTEPETRAFNKTITSRYSLGGNNDTRSDGEEDSPYVHVFNFGEDDGYAIVSGDRRVPPILCLADEGSLHQGDSIDNIGSLIMLSGIDTKYRLLTGLPVISSNGDTVVFRSTRDTSDIDPPEIDPSLYSYSYNNWETLNTNGTILACQWDQESPFSDYCLTESGDSSFAGCTPVAVGQIMYHWGITHDTSGRFWDWPLMRTITMHNSSGTYSWHRVKTLLRTLGDADNLDADYGTTGTDADINNAPRTFINFGFSSGGTIQDYDYSILCQNLYFGPALGSGSAIMQVTQTYILGILVNTHYHYTDKHTWVYDKCLTKRRRVDVYYDNVFHHSYYEYLNLIHCNFGLRSTSGDTSTYLRANGYYLSPYFDLTQGPVMRSTTTTTYGTENYYQFKLKMNCGIRGE